MAQFEHERKGNSQKTQAAFCSCADQEGLRLVWTT